MVRTFLQRTAAVAAIGIFLISSANATEYWTDDQDCHDTGSCNDGLYCNGQETCDENDQCVAGAPPCDLGYRCREECDAPYYSCTEITGLCYDGDGNWEATTLEDCANAHPDRQWSEWQDEPPCPKYSSGLNARAGVIWILHGVAANPYETYYRLGDDYTIANESFLYLERFRFFGGVDRAGGSLIFRFWDGSVDPPVEVDGFSISLPQPGIFVWTIGTGANPLGITIPPIGYVTMEAGDALTTGHWISADNVAMLGDNNDGLLWVDDDRVAYLSAQYGDPDILTFELMGKECPEPLAPCCVETVNTIECELKRPWLCENAAPREGVPEVPSHAITYLENNSVSPKPKKNKCTTQVVPTCGGGGVEYESMAACASAVIVELATTGCTDSGADCIPCVSDGNDPPSYSMGTGVKCKLKNTNDGCDGDGWTCQALSPAPSMSACGCTCQGPPQ